MSKDRSSLGGQIKVVANFDLVQSLFLGNFRYCFWRKKSAILDFWMKNNKNIHGVDKKGCQTQRFLAHQIHTILVQVILHCSWHTNGILI